MYIDPNHAGSLVLFENQFGEQVGAKMVSILLEKGPDYLYEEVRRDFELREAVWTRIVNFIKSKRPKPGERGYDSLSEWSRGEPSFVELLNLSQYLEDEEWRLEGVEYAKPEPGNRHWSKKAIKRKRVRQVLVRVFHAEVESQIPIALAREEREERKRRKYGDF